MNAIKQSRWSRLFFTCSTVAGSVYVIDELNSHILSRSCRVLSTGASIVIDFKSKLKSIDRGTEDYKSKLQDINQRTADKILALCLKNGGIYTKFGQQLSTFNHALPREYTETLSQLQDKAVPVEFEKVIRAIEEEMGQPWHNCFQFIETECIAAASLAQVHKGVDFKGREVAIKVQYPHLERQMSMDLVVIGAAFQVAEHFFPDVSLKWIYPDFEQALKSELNFESEKLNSRRIYKLLEHNPSVHVPTVYDELSSKRLLTMEFINGAKISEVNQLKLLGFDTKQIATTLCEVFGEMIFCHGFVHCDPHAGNIFVRIHPDRDASKPQPQLVLLDHGLYRELDDEFRRTYCDLWKAMLTRDSELLEQCGKKLNAGSYAKYLPLMFTYRSIRSSSPLGSTITEEERQKLREDLQQIHFSHITDFLHELPRDMLFVFRTNNMIRALNKDLGESSKDRFYIMGKYAVKGHELFHKDEKASFLSKCKYLLENLRIRFNLQLLDWSLGLVQYLRGGEFPQQKHVG